MTTYFNMPLYHKIKKEREKRGLPVVKQSEVDVTRFHPLGGKTINGYLVEKIFIDYHCGYFLTFVVSKNRSHGTYIMNINSKTIMTDFDFFGFEPYSLWVGPPEALTTIRGENNVIFHDAAEAIKYIRGHGPPSMLQYHCIGKSPCIFCQWLIDKYEQLNMDKYTFISYIYTFNENCHLKQVLQRSNRNE